MTARKAPASEVTEAAPTALPASGGAYVLVDGIPTPETPEPADDAALTQPEA
jgi:hypothetical protein